MAPKARGAEGKVTFFKLKKSTVKGLEGKNIEKLAGDR